MTRPRAAEQISATIYARLVALRREREQASKQDNANAATTPQPQAEPHFPARFRR